MSVPGRLANHLLKDRFDHAGTTLYDLPLGCRRQRDIPLTLVFAVAGIVLMRIWVRRNRATKESFSYTGCSLAVLVTCILLFLIALPWLVLRGDLS